MIPIHFIGERVEVQFDVTPTFSKTPGCPAGFVWQDETYRITELLSEWRDYGRRGRMSNNMRPDHLTMAKKRGSWGVGRIYFRVRTESDQIFDLYYDRAPGSGRDRKGAWWLFRELGQD